jgi:hypothetical protein
MQDKLEAAMGVLEKMRTDLLFDEDFADGVVESLAKFEFLTGLMQLEQVVLSFRKAHLHQTKALAQSPYRW